MWHCRSHAALQISMIYCISQSHIVDINAALQISMHICKSQYDIADLISWILVANYQFGAKNIGTQCSLYNLVAQHGLKKNIRSSFSGQFLQFCAALYANIFNIVLVKSVFLLVFAGPTSNHIGITDSGKLTFKNSIDTNEIDNGAAYQEWGSLLQLQVQRGWT